VLRSDPVLSEIPVVALTSTATMDRESLHLIDVDDWVAKPSDIDQILAAVRPSSSQDRSRRIVREDHSQRGRRVTGRD
jgi:CheY-like chemotaxis protein